MKLTEIKDLVKQVVAEAKKAKEAGLPKSGGKLVHLKKELAGLKKMQESVGQLALTEGDNEALVAEYAHMQKYVNDYNKIKEASAKLSEKLGSQISVVEEKIKAETQKIKELMGMAEPVEEKKGKKVAKKEKEIEEGFDTNEFQFDEEDAINEARFEKGEDIGKPGKGFAKIAKSAAKQYGSKEAGQKVAGSILKKVLNKEGSEELNEVDMQEILPALIASGLLSTAAISAVKQAIKDPKKFVDDVRKQGKLPDSIGKI